MSKLPKRPEAPTLPATGLVRLATVLQVYPISRTSWYAGVKDGRFPRPIKIGARTAAYKVEDIRALLDNQYNQVAE